MAKSEDTVANGVDDVTKEPVDDSGEETDGAQGAAAEESTTAGGRRAAEKPKESRSAPKIPVKETVVRARTIVARVVWVVCLLAALALAIGALLIVLDANRDNDLVTFVLDMAGVADVGFFDRDNGILTFTGEDAETKNVLVNWGLGALAWLIVGKVVERVIHP